MIVISGALVLVALVLLVLGLTMTDLNFVYGSIAVSLISFVFLVIGILQRRGEQPAEAGSGAPEVTDDGSTVAVEPVSPAKTGSTGSVPVTADDPADGYDEVGEEEVFAAAGGATVLVVPGRPRYHVDGCRYLTGKEVEELDVADARAQYSPCGVCKPDAVVDAQLGPVDDEPVVEEEPVAPRARRASSTRTSRSTSGTAARSGRRAPARTRSAAAATTAVSTVEPPDPAVATEPDATEALEAPAAAATPAAAAPAKSAPRRKVVVIPDRGRFHTADCRFVRDALGTQELSRTAATKQGYKACGVCKP